MRHLPLLALVALAAVGCAPAAGPARPAPDTPAGVAPKPGYSDNKTDTDPSSPRTRAAPGAKPVVPVLTD